MPDQAAAGTTLYVPLAAVRTALGEDFSPGFIEDKIDGLTDVALRLPTEGLENLEPLLTALEEFKVKLAQRLERFEQATARSKTEAEAAVEEIGRAPALALLTEFVSLLGRRELLPPEAHASLAGLLKLVTLKIRQLDKAILMATFLTTAIDGAVDDFRKALRDEPDPEPKGADDAEKLAQDRLEAYLTEILWLLRQDILPGSGTPLLACDPDQLPFHTKAAIRDVVGRFYP